MLNVKPTTNLMFWYMYISMKRSLGRGYFSINQPMTELTIKVRTVSLHEWKDFWPAGAVISFFLFDAWPHPFGLVKSSTAVRYEYSQQRNVSRDNVIDESYYPNSWPMAFPKKLFYTGDILTLLLTNT